MQTVVCWFLSMEMGFDAPPETWALKLNTTAHFCPLQQTPLDQRTVHVSVLYISITPKVRTSGQAKEPKNIPVLYLISETGGLESA
jgi:hypothetical protein